MANVFISYNHQSESIVRTLVSDIEFLDNTVWFDQKLNGGQAWWDQILAEIRDCDVFVFVLASESRDSEACKREYNYADAIGKPILPILVADGVTINLLSPALSKFQHVDYRQQDRSSAFRLARAFAALPAPQPLPNPLPTPPQAPISYLGSLTDRIETTDTLSYEDQSSLLLDLNRSLRRSETIDGARTLLKKMRNRTDTLLIIAEEIDQLLSASSAQINNNKSNRKFKIIQRERIETACIGFFFGIMLASMATTAHDFRTPYIILWLFTGSGGAISGAISGTKRQFIKNLYVALIGFFTVALSWYLFFNPNAVAALSVGAIVGTTLGGIIGAIIGIILRNLQKEHNP